MTAKSVTKALAKRFSENQIRQMKKVCTQKITFSELVAEITSVKSIGKWHAVNCRFHETQTMDAGRLKDYDPVTNDYPVYFCNHPDCSIQAPPYNGRLSMFQYWQLANSFDSEEEGVVDLYSNVLLQELPEPDGSVLSEKEIREIEDIERRRLLFLHTVFFFNKVLFSEEGRAGLDYLTEKRGIPVEYLQKYYVGYAPGGRKLKEYLVGVGFSEEEVSEATLLSKKGNDLYFEMVTIPLFSLKDNVLGGKFSIKTANVPNLYCRKVDSFIKTEEDRMMKHRYTNREMPLFNFQEAQRKKTVVIPEGCMDAISGQVLIDRLVEMKKAGLIPSELGLDPSNIGVFASFGTSGFSEKGHLPLVKKARFETVYIAGDQDGNFAGQMSNIKKGKLLRLHCPETHIRIVRWPRKDLNEMLSQGCDPLDFLRALKDSLSLEEYIVSVALDKSGDLEVTRNQFEAIHRIEDVISDLFLDEKIENAILYSRFVSEVARRVGVSPETILLHVYLKRKRGEYKSLAAEHGVSLHTALLSKISLMHAKEGL